MPIDKTCIFKIDFRLLMKDPILLVIQDPSSRQLYHELFVTRNMEVIPLAHIEDVFLLEAIRPCDLIVIYADDIDSKEFELFMGVQKRVELFSKSRIVLLTSSPEQYESDIGDGCEILDLSHSNPKEVADRIESM